MSPKRPRVYFHHQMKRRRKPRKRVALKLAELSEEQILEWADAFHRDRGRWPSTMSGSVGLIGENWNALHQALRKGHRGLPGGTSLARLLLERRGVRNVNMLPHLTRETVLAWADEHLRRTGKWPSAHSGPVADAPGETWNAVDGALTLGRRGLPSGSSLAQLLTEQRGIRNIARLPPLTHRQILAWADEHFRRMGRWPSCHGGPIRTSQGESWEGVDSCLRAGGRGLPGGYSLSRLLANRRGARNDKALPALVPEQIVIWAKAHYQRTGKWPNGKSGRIVEAPTETWNAVNLALQRGSRGLKRGGSSLAKLREKHCVKMA